MIVAGSGGHALEVLDEWISLLPSEELVFFDEFGVGCDYIKSNFRVVLTTEDLAISYKHFHRFSLGVGNSHTRKKLYDLLEETGRQYKPLHSKSSLISPSAAGLFDTMALAFVGPQVYVGLGSLINTRAHVHHECLLGSFVEVGPGAILLGKVKVGSFSQIGAGAVILPGVEIGEEVKVGAGAVVTKNISSGRVVKGVPAE